MHYRPEIDGLRAVAVMPVIFFHANFTAFSGGFVGVDVFFVISGYLITTIIIKELASGHFSLGQFYARRARRILPALFLVVAVCIPFAWLWMIPSQFAAFGRSALAVLLFVPNLHFWGESGYFTSTSDLMPLLHTWSLGVEEQFYVFFPLLLMLTWRFGHRALFAILLSIALLSLLWAELQWRLSPPVSFYLPHTRAWELLAGSLCALVLARRVIRGNQWLAAFGLAMILVAVVRFNWWTEMPGIRGLLPVVGTALIILFGCAGTVVGWLLSRKVFVGIGLISYSTYLWHQPLFAFARLRNIGEPSVAVLLGLSAVSLLLGWLTWKLVETPWRRRGGITFRRPKASLAVAGGFAAALAGVGVTAVATEGLPQRLPDVPRRQMTEGTWSEHCLFQARGGRVRFPTNRCIFGEGTFRVAVLGDSIAAAMAPAVIDYLDDQDAEIHQLTHGMCMPAVRTIAVTPLASACADYMERAVSHLEEIGVDLVITAGSWPDFGEKTLYDGQSISAMTEVQKNLVAQDITDTLERLEAPVILVMPYPHADLGVLNTAAKHYMATGNVIEEMTVPRNEFLQDNQVAFDVLDRIDSPFITRIKAHEALCDETQCYFVRAHKLIISDDQHLTRYGAELVLERPEVAQVLEQVIPEYAVRRRGQQAIDGG